ncbi:MAG: TlpA family protein disulfide reductase, partial [Pirellulaceae bacterium]
AFVGLSTESRRTDELGLAVLADGARPTERPAAVPYRAPSQPIELALLTSSPADETAPDETATEGRDANPYLAAADWDARQLTTFLLDMQDKPQSIQSRPGFAAALVDAADRILAASPTAPQRRTAVLTKFAALQRMADSGDPAADRKLVELADQCQADPSAEIAAEVALVRTQAAALAASNLPLDQLPAVIDALREGLSKQKLTQRHLRTASAIVDAINRLGDDDFREARFAEFGALFAKSDSRDLARYGQRLAPPSAEGLAEWIGKPIELAGTTLVGEPFDWTRLRGRVVVVQVWASWCGPCREELPRLKELHGRLAEQGLEVVGVSVDKDTEAAAKFVEEHPLPWTTLVGQDALDFARRLGIRGIPTLLLVDPQGRVVAHANQVAKLADKAESLLASAGG